MKTNYFDTYLHDRNLTRVCTVRLYDTEICILDRHFPGGSLSYKIRSAIHALDRHSELPQE